MILDLEQADQKTAVCECCGATTHTVWGFVRDSAGARCAYFANWSEGSDHAPHVAMGYGSWGDGTSAEDRASIYAELHGGAWRFVDHAAPGAPPGQEDVLGRALRGRDAERRPDVVETLHFIVRTDGRLPF